MINRSNLPEVKKNRRRSLKLEFLAAVCLCFLAFSCEAPALYDQYQAIENTTWEKDKAYYFTFQITDARIPYDLTLEVRNNNLYPYQNLWLFCQEEPPIGPMKRDTIECLLADAFGKWYGHGISLFQSSFPLRTRYLFPHEGQYTFSFRQGMRSERLTGIQEIGLRVEEASPLNAPSATHPSEGK